MTAYAYIEWERSQERRWERDREDDPHAGCVTPDSLCPECRAQYERDMAEMPAPEPEDFPPEDPTNPYPF